MRQLSFFHRLTWIALFLVITGCDFVAPDGELKLDGEFTQGGLVIGTAVSGARVTLNGEPIRVYADGRFMLGFGRNALAVQALEVRWPSRRTESLELSIEPQTYRVQHINGVDQSRVTPPQDQLDKIALETQQTNAARSLETPTPFFDAGWIWPTSGPVTGVYGSARIYNGTPGNPHWGIDIAAPTGTPVLAPAGGVVQLVHQANHFAGGLVILDHGYGLTSSFLHLSRIDVTPGDVVAQGMRLGAVGSTGRSTGPHLDWRMNLGKDIQLDVSLLPLPTGP